MTNKSQEERLAVLETKMDIVIKQQEDTNEKLGKLVTTLATKSELERLAMELENAKKKHALQTWVTGTLSAVFGAVMTLLIKSYLE